MLLAPLAVDVPYGWARTSIAEEVLHALPQVRVVRHAYADCPAVLGVLHHVYNRRRHAGGGQRCRAAPSRKHCLGCSLLKAPVRADARGWLPAYHYLARRMAPGRLILLLRIHDWVFIVLHHHPTQQMVRTHADWCIGAVELNHETLAVLVPSQASPVPTIELRTSEPVRAHTVARPRDRSGAQWPPILASVEVLHRNVWNCMTLGPPAVLLAHRSSKDALKRLTCFLL